MLKKREVVAVSDGGHPSGGGVSPFGESYPAISQFLTLFEWPGEGGERTPGTLLLFPQDGGFKARLVDVDADECCFVFSRSLGELLEAVEAILEHGGGEWRKQKPGPWRGKSKN